MIFNLMTALVILFASISTSSEQAHLPDSSLYQLHSQWTSDVGTKMKLENLRGKARVLTLFFGHCESSCPMVVTTLKTMESVLPKGWNGKAGIVLVSLDPKRDDVESLSEYRKRMSLAKDSWTLLRGKEQDTRELAMALGVAYKPSKDNGGMDHNAVIVVLDKDGRIVARHEGAVESQVLADELNAAIK